MRLGNITQDFICQRDSKEQCYIVLETGRQASKEKRERIGRSESKRIVR